MFGGAPFASIPQASAGSHIAIGALTLPAFTVAGTGERVVTGVGATTLPVFTAAGTGERSVVGTGAATLPAITTAGTASWHQNVTGAILLPAMTTAGVLEREITSGLAGIVFPPLQTDGTAEREVTGSGALSLPAVLAAGSQESAIRRVDVGAMDSGNVASIDRSGGNVVELVQTGRSVVSDTFYIKQNDTGPALRVTLRDANLDPIDVTGATIRFHMRAEDDTTKVDAGAVVVTAASGIIEYVWAAADTDTIGSYRAEFEVTYSDATIETFPNTGYIRVRIKDDIA